VVGLPTNLFYGNGHPSGHPGSQPCQESGPESARCSCIEASREFKEGGTQNYLREEDVNKIAGCLPHLRDVEKYARVVSIEEIEKNDFNLNISRYV